MSFRPEVIADASGKWFSNGLLFATEKEAADYVTDLEWRWTSVRQTRVVAVDENPTYRWNAENNRAEKLA
jgi:hypothetical protein